MTAKDEMERRGYVTVPTAARRSTLGRSTIYRGVESGDIEAQKAGRVTYVSVDSLLRFVGPVLADRYRERAAEENGASSSRKRAR